MKSPRRTFLKTSLAAAGAALGTRLAAGDAPDQEFYELRCYHLQAGSRLKADADPALLDSYLEHALLPALCRLGLRRTGVFTELAVDKPAGRAQPLAGSPVWVLIAHPSLTTFVRAAAVLSTDPVLLEAGRDYLQVPKSTPAFERIDTWLYLAFAGMPRLELPAFSRNRVPSRVFEMRDYESHGELKALNKIAMFNDGEIELMKDLGMNPVFFGQSLAGPDLPHLRYFTSGPDLETHLAGWKKFGPDPRWVRMRGNPLYADNTSKNTARFLAPKPYSQI